MNVRVYRFLRHFRVLICQVFKDLLWVGCYKMTPCNQLAENGDRGRHSSSNPTIPKVYCCYYSKHRISFREVTKLVFCLRWVSGKLFIRIEIISQTMYFLYYRVISCRRIGLLLCLFFKKRRIPNNVD